MTTVLVIGLVVAYDVALLDWLQDERSVGRRWARRLGDWLRSR